LKDLFNPQMAGRREEVVTSTLFSRACADLPGGATILRDDFPEAGGATCLFVRIPPAQDRPDSIRFAVEGAYRVASCAAGGWLLEALDATQSSYWIPQVPSLRSFDQHDRIVQ
jgi:hypothetical protein